MDHSVHRERFHSSCVGRSSSLKRSIKGIKHYFNFISKYTKRSAKKMKCIGSISWLEIISTIFVDSQKICQACPTKKLWKLTFKEVLAVCSNKLYFEHEKLLHICRRCHTIERARFYSIANNS